MFREIMAKIRGCVLQVNWTKRSVVNHSWFRHWYQLKR